MKENLSPFTLFIKLFVHFLTLLLLSKMRFWQPGFMLLVNAAGHKVLMGGAIWPWGGRKGSTCTHPLLNLPSLGRSWPYMLAAFCSCCRFERRLTNPPGAGDANSRRLGFFFFFLFFFPRCRIQLSSQCCKGPAVLLLSPSKVAPWLAES